MLRISDLNWFRCSGQCTLHTAGAQGLWEQKSGWVCFVSAENAPLIFLHLQNFQGWCIYQYWINQPRTFPEPCYSKAVNLRTFSCAKSSESIVRTLITCKAEIIYLWQQNYTFIGKINRFRVQKKKKSITSELGLMLRLWHKSRTFKAVQLSSLTTETSH